MSSLLYPDEVGVDPVPLLCWSCNGPPRLAPGGLIGCFRCAVPETPLNLWNKRGDDGRITDLEQALEDMESKYETTRSMLDSAENMLEEAKQEALETLGAASCDLDTRISELKKRWST